MCDECDIENGIAWRECMSACVNCGVLGPVQHVARLSANQVPRHLRECPHHAVTHAVTLS